jgi:hypothetical protein
MNTNSNFNLINLFDSKYIKSLKCDKPQRDGLEISNLLNDNKNSTLFSRCLFL